jgi:hypothetical protein
MNMLGLSSNVHFAHITCYLKILTFALHKDYLSVQALQSRSCLSYIVAILNVKATLRLTVSHSVSLCVKPHLGLMTRYSLLLTVKLLIFWSALSDERTGLPFVYAADPRQRSLPRVRVPWDS